MVSNVINKVNDSILKSSDSLNLNIDETNEYIDYLKRVSSAIKEFLNEYEKTGNFNFSMLVGFENYFIENHVYKSGVDYNELVSIKLELDKNFPGRIFDIDKELDDLLRKMPSVLRTSINEYRRYVTEKRMAMDRIDELNKIKRFIKKIEDGYDILSSNEISLIERLDINEEERLELYSYVVTNNSKLMLEILNRRKEADKKAAKEAERRKLEEARKRNVEDKQAEQSNSVEPKPVMSEHSLSEQEKSLLNYARYIIKENDITDKSFLVAVEGCTPLEIYEFLYDYGDATNNIALVLNDVIIPKINDRSLNNIEEVLHKYVSTYSEIKRNNSIPCKLKNANMQDVLEVMQKAENLIEYYKENEEELSKTMIGYFNSLKNLLHDVEFSILDDEVFATSLFLDTFADLKEAVDYIEKLMNSNKKTNDDDKLEEDVYTAEDFYKDSNSIIFFPPGVNLSEQIDEDGSLESVDKKRVLLSLKKFCNKEKAYLGAMHSHHVSDHDNIDLYKKLKSFRTEEYRIFYRVLSAPILEKIYGKKLDILFVFKVGYGEMNKKKKDRLNNAAKTIYLASSDYISQIDTILKSNDIEKIKALVNEQFDKMNDYIKESSIRQDVPSSIGSKGGSEDE